MPFRLRRLELGPTLMMLGLVTLLFGLGGWQLYRLHWKTAYLAEIHAKQGLPPLALATVPSSVIRDHINDLAWRRVRVTGTFLHDKELYATPRYFQDRLGYAVLTPLQYQTPHGLERILINRGWVAPEQKSPATRGAGNVSGPVTVTGVIRGNLTHPLFRPDNQPGRNLWFWYDLAAMKEALHLPMLPVLLDATDTRLANLSGRPGGGALSTGPQAFPVEVSIRNDHLGYAITWFLIGAAGCVIFILYHREP